MKCRVGLAQSTAREVECAEVSESQLPQPPPEPLGMTHELLATCSKHNSHNIASEPAGDQTTPLDDIAGAPHVWSCHVQSSSPSREVGAGFVRVLRRGRESGSDRSCDYKNRFEVFQCAHLCATILATIVRKITIDAFEIILGRRARASGAFHTLSGSRL